MKRLFLYILVCVFLQSQYSLAQSFSSKYDRDIKKATKAYWLDFPHWKYWKAQIYQESRFDPHAVSPVGAKGLAQFMPATWRQIGKELGYTNYSPYTPTYAIRAGAYYMRKLRNSWSWSRPRLDKHNLALASYNGGIGNILKAQKLCNNAILYQDIIKCLPEITGKHSKETIDYIQKVRKWYLLMQ